MRSNLFTKFGNKEVEKSEEVSEFYRKGKNNDSNWEGLINNKLVLVY